MSYTIEVFKGKQKAEKNLFVYALYVMFYPQLVAGPIERSQQLLPQLKKKHKFNYNSVTDGLKLMTWGFFQKIVIADRLATFVNPVYSNPHAYDGISFIVATVFFAIQIYCDFAGYVDIARGSARVMGIKLVENFNRPYLSSSIREFWRRWHISLFSWFRDYLYIPLGGNRKGQLRTMLNIAIVFFITGLWHGAKWNFVIWGLIHGFYIIVGIILTRLGLRLYRPLGVLITFTLVCIAWIFFRANSVQDALYIVTHLTQNVWDFAMNITDRNLVYNKLFIRKSLSEVTVTLFLLSAFAFVEFKRGSTEVEKFLFAKKLRFRWILYYSFILCILIFGVFRESKFIYFQF